MSNPITPGNRAGASHDPVSKSIGNNTVTPNNHASGSFQEDDQYGGYNHNHHPPPPYRNQYNTPDGRERGGHGGGPYYNKYPQPPPVMPAMHEDSRERDSYGHGNNGYPPSYNNGYEPPSYPHQPPHPSTGSYSHQGYDDRERYGRHPNGPPPPYNGSYYGDEGPPPNSNPHGPPPYEGRNYRGNNERDPYYSNGPPDREHERDMYGPPPPYDGNGGNSPGNSPYMQNHKAHYPYGNSHERPPRNDQVIFRNNYQDSGGRPSHRSDGIHSYVTAEEGPPHHYNSGNSSPERYDNVNHHGGPEQPPMMYPSNVPRYERHAPPPHAGYEDTHGPPPEHVRMVSPHRRGPMRQQHRRQFSNESDSSPHNDYGRPPPPPPNYNHHHGYPPPNYNYPPTSPMRRMHGPGHSPYPPPMPYPNGHPHHIPLTLTNSHSFESSHRATPPPIPQATHPTCTSIAEVNSNDVLCGRGGGTNSQIGNRRFRKLVQEYQPEYLVARRKAKPHISKTIVQIVRKRGGRFLKKEESTGYLYEVGDERAEAKTSQALREGLDVRACSGSKKKDEQAGRETPVVKNSEEGSLKRKRGEDDELEKDANEENAESTEDKDTDSPPVKSEEKEELDQDFSPPRSKQKLEDDNVTEEKTEKKEEESKEGAEESKMWPVTAV